MLTENELLCRSFSSWESARPSSQIVICSHSACSPVRIDPLVLMKESCSGLSPGRYGVARCTERPARSSPVGEPHAQFASRVGARLGARTGRERGSRPPSRPRPRKQGSPRPKPAQHRRNAARAGCETSNEPNPLARRLMETAVKTARRAERGDCESRRANRREDEQAAARASERPSVSSEMTVFALSSPTRKGKSAAGALRRWESGGRRAPQALSPGCWESARAVTGSFDR